MYTHAISRLLLFFILHYNYTSRGRVHFKLSQRSPVDGTDRMNDICKPLRIFRELQNARNGHFLKYIPRGMTLCMACGKPDIVIARGTKQFSHCTVKGARINLIGRTNVPPGRNPHRGHALPPCGGRPEAARLPDVRGRHGRSFLRAVRRLAYNRCRRD